MKSKKSVYLLPALCVLLAACGSGAPNTPARRKAAAEAAPPADQKACPATRPSSSHKIVLSFQMNIPANLGLKLDGDTDFRLSNCAETTQRGVLASWRRESNRQLVITVDHRDGYNNGLPATANFEIFDLQTCGAGSSTFFKPAAPLILHWRTEPVSSTCPWHVAVGEAKFQGFLEAEAETAAEL